MKPEEVLGLEGRIEAAKAQIAEIKRIKEEAGKLAKLCDQNFLRLMSGGDCIMTADALFFREALMPALHAETQKHLNLLESI